MDITFVNLTPHAISVRSVSGDIVTFPASGCVARVGTEWSKRTDVGAFETYTVTYTSIEGLPSVSGENDRFIVSALVLEAAKASQHHLLEKMVAPATGHAGVTRNDKGHVLDVPGFVTGA